MRINEVSIGRRTSAWRLTRLLSRPLHTQSPRQRTPRSSCDALGRPRRDASRIGHQCWDQRVGVLVCLKCPANWHSPRLLLSGPGLGARADPDRCEGRCQWRTESTESRGSRSGSPVLMTPLERPYLADQPPHLLVGSSREVFITTLIRQQPD